MNYYMLIFRCRIIVAFKIFTIHIHIYTEFMQILAKKMEVHRNLVNPKYIYDIQKYVECIVQCTKYKVMGLNVQTLTTQSVYSLCM